MDADIRPACRATPERELQRNLLPINERYVGRVIWNRSTWVKDPDSGRRTRRERPESAWVVTDSAALVDADTWEKVQQRLKERATGQRRGQPRRYLLSGLLVCERCGARLVVTSKPARYACGTFLYGGPAACPIDATARREEVEDAILEPVRSALLSDEAVQRFCSLIREWYRREQEQAARGISPAAEAIGAEIADLEALIAERPARAATLRAAIEDLRQKQVNLQRATWRRAAAPDIALPAEGAYRAAVSDINGALQGGNVEAARAALRGLLGNIPVFQIGRHLAVRLTMKPAALLSNPGNVLLIGSGGLIPTNSTSIVPFSSADRRRKMASNEVPDQCGNGHRLTPDNVRINRREGRWRCRQCGCDRAAAFRDRQRTG